MMGYPKKKRRKRHRRHSESIIQDKDGRCLLCMCLAGDRQIHRDIEEHHVFFGTGQRWKSEEDGLVVYLCPEHHRIGRDAVHRNAEICRAVKRVGQIAYEAKHSREEFMKRYGKSYLGDAD